MREKVRAALTRLLSQLEHLQGRLKPLYDERIEHIFVLILVCAAVTVFALFRAGRADMAVWIGGVAFFLAGVLGLYASSDRETWVKQIAPELIGISIGVIAVDQIYQVRFEQQQKQEIVLQMASPSNAFAVEAARIARNKGWLFDGTFMRANLMDANLDGAFFVNANLREANLWEASLQGADLRGVYLDGAFLAGVSLQGADLWNAKLKGAVLGSANLQGADLRDANLSGADLRNTNLQNVIYSDKTSWQGAIYNDKTVWPDGFDIIAKGVIHNSESTPNPAVAPTPLGSIPAEP